MTVQIFNEFLQNFNEILSELRIRTEFLTNLSRIPAKYARITKIWIEGVSERQEKGAENVWNELNIAPPSPWVHNMGFE